MKTDLAKKICSHAAFTIEAERAAPFWGELRSRYCAMRDYFSDMPDRDLTPAESALLEEMRAAMMLGPPAGPAYVFTCGGYEFFKDSAGLWNAAAVGSPPPTRCAYASPEAIAKLKGVRL